MHGQEQEDRGVKHGLPAPPAYINGPERPGFQVASWQRSREKERIYFFTMVIFAFKPLFARNAPSLPSMSVVRVPMRTRNISW
jgi:hypothetical protein